MKTLIRDIVGYRAYQLQDGAPKDDHNPRTGEDPNDSKTLVNQLPVGCAGRTLMDQGENITLAHQVNAVLLKFIVKNI